MSGEPAPEVFLRFRPGEKWLLLAKQVVDLIEARSSEMRWSLNQSPTLERYVRAYFPDGDVIVSPMCPTATGPGLLIYSVHLDLSGCYETLRHAFGDRVICGNLDLDEPEDAVARLAEFDDHSLNLVDGEIVPF